MSPLDDAEIKTSPLILLFYAVFSMKTPIMKCTTKNIEMCPYSYNVEFKATQEEVGVYIFISNFLLSCGFRVFFYYWPTEDL